MTEKRQAQWAKIQNANFLTRNEKREAAGYSPIAGGDEDNDGDSDPAPAWGASKFNPNHDELGRFTFGAGGGASNTDNNTNPPSGGSTAPSGGSGAIGGSSQNDSGRGVIPVSYNPDQFDAAGAVDALNQAVDKLKADKIANGQPNLFGEGKCAHYVANAVEQGGGLPATSRPQDAKNFGSWLENNNFSPVASWDGQPSSSISQNGYVSDYTPQAGDVAVIQPYDGGNPSGHMDMYNGSQWVSDFRQQDIWGGKGYRTQQPSYVIYRYGSNGAKA